MAWSGAVISLPCAGAGVGGQKNPAGGGGRAVELLPTKYVKHFLYIYINATVTPLSIKDPLEIL